MERNGKLNYLVDTNHWSYILKEKLSVIDRVNNLSPKDSLLMSVITQGELLAGVNLIPNLKRRDNLLKIYEEIFDSTIILPIDSQVAKEYSKIFFQLRKDGKPISTNDIWIAATAKTHKLVIVTNDKHFDFIKGIKVENWSVV